jgi:hypothetical protein
MNRITAFTDVEFDEHHRMSRRCQRGFPELSVEERAWLEYQRDPQGTEDRLDLAENEDAREEFTGVALAVLAWVVVFGVIDWFTS